MADNKLLNGPKAPQRPEAAGPPRVLRDPRAQAEGLLREVAYVLHLTRRVTAAMTGSVPGPASRGGRGDAGVGAPPAALAPSPGQGSRLTGSAPGGT